MTLNSPPEIASFDFEDLKLPQNFSEQIGVKKLLTSVSVRKPSKQEFLRVHRGADYCRDLPLIEFKEDDTFYAVAPALINELSDLLVPASVYTAITRQGTPFLLPVKLPGPDGKSHPAWDSKRAAAEHAKREWLRIQWNKEANGFDIFVAPGLKEEPVWPDLSFSELLKLGFQGRLIDTPDHLVIRKLRGLA